MPYGVGSIYPINSYEQIDPTQAAAVEVPQENVDGVEAIPQVQSTEASGQKQDAFLHSDSGSTTIDTDYINSVKSSMKGNIGAFQRMVEFLYSSQADNASGTDLTRQLLGLMNTDPEAAKAAIADGGEWSVDAVADRILGMAKAFAGSDPEKLEAMRKAVEKGFEAAEKLWGGKLPDISYKTREKVMAGFDEWAAEIGASVEETAAE